MSFTLLVTATDLQTKAELLGTRAKLPHFIRRLIQRADPTAKGIQFRTAEGTQLEGWDGLVDDATGNDYVPTGCSAWELGVDRAVKKKADEDYKKRTNDPLGLDKLKTTYVFVTPRRWSAKSKWVAEKQGKGDWKEVRAYDADDLITWLETAPGVHIWMSNELGKYPGGVTDLQTWWDDWAALTTPILPLEVLLAGRDETTSQIVKWLSSPEETFSLQAGTRAEAVATLAATVLGLSVAERSRYLDQIVIVQNEASWQELIAREEGLILVPEFESADVLGAATRRRHRVFLPLDAASIPTADVITIVPNQWESMREALEAIGIKQPGADELAYLARRSFSAFRRKWLNNPAANALQWAHPDAGNNLLPALLLGAWEEEHEGDRSIVEQLVGQSYEAYRQQLVSWMHAPDAPVREVAGTWFVIDKADAWEQLSRLLSPDLFNRYESVVLKVLGTPDPRFALPDDEQRWARTRGIARAHSTRLRGGIADTLALIGANGQNTRISARKSANEGVAQILIALFELANTDSLGHVWASFGSDIRALAEADPAIFLQFVLEDLSHKPPVLLTLFQEREGLFYRSSEHTGLLWALEALAWNPDYLFHATLALAKLAEFDPGGQISNRPANSLRQIFLLWLPQTTANLDDRLAVLDKLRHEVPEVAWRLFVRLLPQAHDVGHHSAMPRWRWRNWKVKQPGPISRHEWFRGIASLTKVILEEAALNASRWTFLFPEFSQWLRHVSPENVEAILRQAEQLTHAQLNDSEVALLRDELGKLLSLHRSVVADWVLPTPILDRLAKLHEAFTPADLSLRYGWVFAQWPKLPTGRKKQSHTEGMKETQGAQDRILSEVFEIAGLDGIMQLVPHVPEPFQLGLAFGRSQWSASEQNSLLSRHLASPELAWENFAEGLLASYLIRVRPEEAEVYIRSQAHILKPAQIARFLSRMDNNRHTWELAQQLGSETNDAYWAWVLPYGITEADTEEAVKHYLAHNRFASAVDAIYHLAYKEEIGPPPFPELLVEALENLARSGAENDRIGRVQSYELQQLIDRLNDAQEIERTRLVRLAFNYQPAFGLSSNPKIIEHELVNNPGFFVELLCLVYRNKNQDEKDIEPIEKGSNDFGRWERAWQILREWNTIPGTQANNEIDSSALLSWIETARTLAHDAGRSTSCDAVIGELLSHARTQGEDTPWPPPAIQEIIELVHSEALIDGLRTGRFNIHGRAHAVTGGVREQKIADNYREWASHYRNAPYTAKLLRELSDRFIRMAQEERGEADLREQLER
jgi:hypothetical protein